MQKARKKELAKLIQLEMEEAGKYHQLLWLCDHLKEYSSRLAGMSEAETISMQPLVNGDALGLVKLAMSILSESLPALRTRSEWNSILDLIKKLEDTQERTLSATMDLDISSFVDELKIKLAESYQKSGKAVV
jgi:hypothetical protein